MAQPESGPRVLAVGDVLAGLRQLLEDRVGRLWVEGQISNLSQPTSGHVYFSLKDDRGRLRAALFRSDARRVAFELEEGMEVLAYGDLTVYEDRGDLQLIVRQLQPQGVGALQLAFEQLRRKLDAEGLFALERKREVPALPRRIAIVTSPTGAALRDVLAVAGRRFPGQPLLVVPTRVQGFGAEHEVVEAIARAATRDAVDVVLLVRGGGSLEDLQAFNTEAVARAIAACPIPVVCGVGHETDTTIADAVADLRAPTPSAAAEAAVPDRQVLGAELAACFDALTRSVQTRLRDGRERLARGSAELRHRSPRARLAMQRSQLAALFARVRAASRAHATDQRRRSERLIARLVRQSPAARVAVSQQRLAELAGRLDRGALAKLTEAGHRVSGLSSELHSLSPLAVLARGYAFARRQDTGRIVRGPGDVASGDALTLRVERAEIDARVEVVRPLPDSEDDTASS